MILLFVSVTANNILLSLTSGNLPLQLIVIRRKCNSTLKEKFQSKTLKITFFNLRTMAEKLLVMFSFTYIYEQTFLTINTNKAKLHSNQKDVNVQSLLRTST
ncbi:hypothetical protein RF11_02950 [Thelohanellus kitauei]|uniref:Uncharacterized protein n=1 Tax=Thelohanellus kitauei TaxID=669202 RepID=A0A0C2J0U1_THEKT|nr:hypothetical protein RF11_02950 [Thelohanellus kitauei]